jgi:hypothetical protein
MTDTSIDRIKDLLNVWAHYYKPLPDRGFPRTCSFVVERVQTSRSTETMVDTVPEDVKRLNDYIESLAPQFKRIRSLEYFDKRPTKTKAELIKIPRQVFALRVRWIYEQLTWSMWGEA